MDLRKYISTVLEDIVAGIQDAQEALGNSVVVPQVSLKNLDPVKSGLTQLQVIEFEVTVGIEQATGAEGKIGVLGSSIGGGKTSESSERNRLKFKVPVQLPTSGKILVR